MSIFSIMPLRLPTSFTVPAFILLVAAAPMAMADDTETHIQEIRTRYDAIQSAKLEKKDIAFESDVDPCSGTYTRYTQDGKLIKIHLSYTYGDHSGLEETYYYQDGKLIFIFASDGTWQFGGKLRADGNPGTIDTVVEHRIYLQDGKVLRHLSKKADNADGKDLAKSISAAKNQPSDDKERRDQLVAQGQKLPAIKDAAGVAKLLVTP